MTQIQGSLPFDDAHTWPAQRRADVPRHSLAGMVLALAIVLIVIGVVMVFSASAVLDRSAISENIFKSSAVRQSIFALLGVACLWISYAIGYRCLSWRGPRHGTELLPPELQTPHPFLFQPATLLLGLSILFLIAALTPGIGIERHGAKRWLQFGPAQYGIGFQPSELAKITVIIFLAVWLDSRRALMRRFSRGILLPSILVGALASLIVIEDLGTAALIVLVGGMLILAAGARWWHAILLSIPFFAAFVGMILIKPYRVERIMSYRDIWADRLGSGYHAIQSLVAIVSGGWMGRGLGAGTQKYGYLPEAKTDFIFAIICEEMGLIGGLGIIALFVCLAILGWRIMVQAPNGFGKLLALGITLMITLQAAMNIAVVTVSVPTKGISLPLISAGGSGVIFYALALGLLASVSSASVQHPPSNQ